MVVRRTNKALQRADQIQSVAERGHSPERRTASSASATPNSNALAEAAARLPQQAGEVNPSGETSKPAVIRTSLRTGMSALREQTDYWLPIVADAEAGFGGPLNAFELMQQMIEEGAAGVHFEDQLASAKKCGHMGGKVLVPAFEFINKLMAARLAADVMGVPTVIVGRTDAEAAKLLTSDFDERDKPFCTGERTSEGFFRIRAGLDLAIARALAYAPYADVLWCETSKPNLAEARRFAEEVKDLYPDKLLAYNCSPSFNWRMNLDEVTIAKFQRELGAMGYKFQFVTLAGFHALNYSMWELARGYRERQMAAYTELQEKEFAAEAEGYSAVKHQAFVGAGYFDEITSICGGCSTQALKDSTEEEQFQDKVPASA
ncbi:MAG: isocitrate lyase [Verrucomicrobia bacterium]|nr:MAG: isocitrate lyase [Verrucomicrobiota bacterium]